MVAEALKCARCNSPNVPFSQVRERNIDLVLVDVKCLDCGFRWSTVMSWIAYKKHVEANITFF